MSHILDGLGGFQEQELAGPSSFVKPRSLLFQQAGGCAGLGGGCVAPTPAHCIDGTAAWAVLQHVRGRGDGGSHHARAVRVWCKLWLSRAAGRVWSWFITNKTCTNYPLLLPCGRQRPLLCCRLDYARWEQGVGVPALKTNKLGGAESGLPPGVCSSSRCAGWRDVQCM